MGEDKKEQNKANTKFRRTLYEEGSHKCGVTNLRKIFKELGGKQKEADEFISKLKADYTDCVSYNNDGTTEYWNFDAVEVVKRLWDIPKFYDILESEGLDTFDKLYYWAIYSKKYRG